jgi:hypothetical protein
MLGKNGIGKGIQWQCALIKGIYDIIREGYGARHFIDGCYQTVALNLGL